MKSWDRRAALSFLLRLTLLLAASWMPLPYLADAYTTVLGEVTNAALSAVDRSFRLGVRFEPPPQMGVDGDWEANLQIEDRSTGQTRRARLDVRAFSYRPVVTFVALAAASILRGRRANAIVWGVGMPAIAVITAFLSALPLLSRLGAAGALGVGGGLAAQTLYQALATPVMMYAIPAGLWGGLLHLTALGKGGAQPVANAL